MSIEIERLYGNIGLYPETDRQGLHFAAEQWGQVTTPGRHNGWDVYNGGRMWLLNGRTVLATTAVAAQGPETLARHQAESARSLEPWARAITHLVQTGEWRERQAPLVNLLDREGTVYRPTEDEPYASEDLVTDYQEWEETVTRHLTPQDRGRTVADRARSALHRMRSEQAAALERACHSLPPAGQEIPALPGEWRWRGALGAEPLATHLAPLLVRAHTRLGAQARDAAVLWAVDSGLMTRAEVHRVTGIARTTINRIMKASACAR